MTFSPFSMIFSSRFARLMQSMPNIVRCTIWHFSKGHLTAQWQTLSVFLRVVWMLSTAAAAERMWTRHLNNAKIWSSAMMALALLQSAKQQLAGWPNIFAKSIPPLAMIIELLTPVIWV